MTTETAHDRAVKRAAEVFHKAPAGSISPIFDALVAAYEEAAMFESSWKLRDADAVAYSGELGAAHRMIEVLCTQLDGWRKLTKRALQEEGADLLLLLHYELKCSADDAALAVVDVREPSPPPVAPDVDEVVRKMRIACEWIDGHAVIRVGNVELRTNPDGTNRYAVTRVIANLLTAARAEARREALAEQGGGK